MRIRSAYSVCSQCPHKSLSYTSDGADLGHGGVDNDNAQYLLTGDPQPRHIYPQELRKWLSSGPSREAEFIVILGTCYSGNFLRLEHEYPQWKRTDAPEAFPSKLLLISAARADKKAYGDPMIPKSKAVNSYFIWYLLKYLEDNKILLRKGLVAYLHKNCPDQFPVLSSSRKLGRDLVDLDVLRRIPASGFD